MSNGSFPDQIMKRPENKTRKWMTPLPYAIPLPPTSLIRKTIVAILRYKDAKKLQKTNILVVSYQGTTYRMNFDVLFENQRCSTVQKYHLRYHHDWKPTKWSLHMIESLLITHHSPLKGNNIYDRLKRKCHCYEMRK